MKIKDLFSTPDTWTKKALAKHTDSGVAGYTVATVVDPNEPAADCWCLSGAVYKTCGRRGVESFKLMKRLAEYIDPETAKKADQSPAADTREDIYVGIIAGWNDADKRSFSDVRELVETLDI